jgi:hypothetical protein
VEQQPGAGPGVLAALPATEPTRWARSVPARRNPAELEIDERPAQEIRGMPGRCVASPVEMGDASGRQYLPVPVECGNPLLPFHLFEVEEDALIKAPRLLIGGAPDGHGCTRNPCGSASRGELVG